MDKKRHRGTCPQEKRALNNCPNLSLHTFCSPSAQLSSLLAAHEQGPSKRLPQAHLSTAFGKKVKWTFSYIHPVKKKKMKQEEGNPKLWLKERSQRETSIFNFRPSPPPSPALSLSPISGPPISQTWGLELAVRSLLSLETEKWLSHRELSFALLASGELEWYQVEQTSQPGTVPGKRKTCGASNSTPWELIVKGGFCYHSTCYTPWMSFLRLVWPREAQLQR